MSEAVLAALRAVAPPAALAAALRGTHERLQDEAVFRLAFAKQARLDALRRHFGGRRLERIWISHNVRLLAEGSGDGRIGALAKGFFADADPATLADRRELLRNSLVIINNNDAHQAGRAEILEPWLRDCPDTLFIAWDWDNHHWLELSLPLAAICDLYCPAHHENLYTLSRFNAAMAVVPCGVVQWTAAFLHERAGGLGAIARRNGLLGKHIQYGGFRFRNQVIATLGPKFPDVRFTTHQFHELSAEEKFAEWAAYKLHLIVPVLNDVPIRVFDAWVTGGIPLVPESLRFSPVLADTDPADIAFYSAADIMAPEALVDRASRSFDAGGEAAIQRRHRHGLDRHHGEQRIRQMIEAARQLIGFAWP